MKIPGLDEITRDLKDLPDATKRMEDRLARIEALLEKLLEVQLATLEYGKAPYEADRLRAKFRDD